MRGDLLNSTLRDTDTLLPTNTTFLNNFSTFIEFRSGHFTLLSNLSDYLLEETLKRVVQNKN